MRQQTRISSGFVAALCSAFACAGAAMAADAYIEHKLDQANKYYEQASKHYGEGSAQLHVRRDGADGSTHTVYHFDCANKNYEVLFSGPDLPGVFPVDPTGSEVADFDRNADVAPLAQHTCTKHGYPLLEW